MWKCIAGTSSTGKLAIIKSREVIVSPVILILMITYTSCPDELWKSISNLGKVYTEPISRSSQLLEEVQTLYENLFTEYQEKYELLTRLSLQVIDHHKMTRANPERLLMHYAARGGHLEVLGTLRDGSLGTVCPWDEWTMVHAAVGGHLGVLGDLRNGSLGGVCPWNQYATLYASREGHLEVLRVLRDGSLGSVCPWNKEKCRYYAEDYPEVVTLIDSGELD